METNLGFHIIVQLTLSCIFAQTVLSNIIIITLRCHNYKWIQFMYLFILHFLSTVSKYRIQEVLMPFRVSSLLPSQ